MESLSQLSFKSTDSPELPSESAPADLHSSEFLLSQMHKKPTVGK